MAANRSCCRPQKREARERIERVSLKLGSGISFHNGGRLLVVERASLLDAFSPRPPPSFRLPPFWYRFYYHALSGRKGVFRMMMMLRERGRKRVLFAFRDDEGRGGPEGLLIDDDDDHRSP